MQSQTMPKETFIIVIFWGMIRGMIRGYDSHNSNILPLLKSAHVKKDSHLNVTTSNTQQFRETSSTFELDNVKNEAIVRDFLQKWKVECRADGLVPMRFAIFPLHLKVLRLPRKSDARSYEVPHLSRKIIFPKLKIWCSKMQCLSGHQRPDLLTSLMNMSLVLRLPRRMHLCRSSAKMSHACVWNRSSGVAQRQLPAAAPEGIGLGPGHTPPPPPPLPRGGRGLWIAPTFEVQVQLRTFFTDQRKLRDQLGIRTANRPTETGKARIAGLGESAKTLKTRTWPKDVLRGRDTIGQAQTTPRRQRAAMGLDRDTPAKDLTLMTSGLSREGAQTTDEISRRSHPRLASDASIPTSGRQPPTKQTHAPDLAEVVSESRGKTQRTGGIPRSVPKTNLPQFRNRAPKTRHGTGETGEKRRRPETLRSTRAAPLMKGLKGPLDRNIQEIRGMTQQEDLLEIDTFVTASGTLDRLPDRPEQARHIIFGRHVTAHVFGNATKPSRFAHFWQGAQSLAPATRNDIWMSKSCPNMLCFEHFWFRNAPQQRALFHTFSTSQLPKVVRTWCVLYILTWTCASRHNGVHFLDISTSKSAPDEVFLAFSLANVLRATTACTFSSLIWPDGSAPAASASLLFDPSEPQIIGKNRVFRDFPTVSRTCVFFLLTLSLLVSSRPVPSLLWLFPPLLFRPYCRKFDF